MRLGDRVRVVAFVVLRLEGVVCYVPGLSAKHRDMEYEGLRHIGIRLPSGEIRQLHWPTGAIDLGRGVTLLARGAEFKPLHPKRQLDPTNDEWEQDER